MSPRKLPAAFPQAVIALALVLPSAAGPLRASGEEASRTGPALCVVEAGELAGEPADQAPAPAPPAAQVPFPSPAGSSEPAAGETSTAPVAQGQEAPAPDPGGGPEASAESEGQPRGEGFLPRLELFFPEGDLDLRASRLVNKVLFEGQLKYNIIEGDITAFLRYRYYGFRRTYQFTLFDAVEFDDIEDLSDEFSRVRGALFLTQWPHDYHHRTFLLGEIDRLISNKEELRFSNNRTNTFVRVGYQLGTPRDERSNAVVGESRARFQSLFTPYRDIGPGDFGITAAATYGFDVGIGDFDYVKLEIESLKRFQLSEEVFLVGRLHAGAFPFKNEVRPEEPLEDRFSIPRAELFRLDGRENLKGVSERLRGTHEAHSTWELFLPWFRDESHPALGLRWETWYWVVYGGVGTIGFDRQVFTEIDDYVFDAGVGFESTFRLSKYRFFLSGIAAHAVGEEGGFELRISLKSSR